ncbi:MAG: hypothetical protein OXL68_08075 [Paracoccaceae bacterium]|nr:hypothetical protein [Paracoccaceae bacterium]
MQTELWHLHDCLSATAVDVSHDHKETQTMSDRIAVINDGRHHKLGGPEEIYRNPASAFTADFIGESTLMPVTVRDGKARCGKDRLSVSRGGSSERTKSQGLC